MKENDIAEAYQGLCCEKLAALAFDQMTMANHAEMLKIVQAVSENDMDRYQNLIGAYYAVSSVWAIEHWKTRAVHAACICTPYIKSAEGEEITEDDTACIRIAETRLLALDEALQAICTRHGFDVASVHKFADYKPYETSSDDIQSDKNFQSEVELALEMILVSNSRFGQMAH